MSRARNQSKNLRRKSATLLDQTWIWRRPCLCLGTVGTRDVEQVAHNPNCQCRPNGCARQVEQVAHNLSNLHRRQTLGEEPDLGRSAPSVGEVENIPKYVEQVARNFESRRLTIAKLSQRICQTELACR